METLEFSCEWTCPTCNYANKDSISPQYGPFVTCTCGDCMRTFDNRQLDADSVASLESARNLADKALAE